VILTDVERERGREGEIFGYMGLVFRDCTS
jgi:hypothetical protein